ncbi:Aste57867_15456 [Aphanomyces stellatus]|uniref:Aste57867_15456 protein n=1 Tax=Aphanomyces stellatus TaxID=120398 RepID=A0A485L511_9STRA|nr:hypothetical protein As57867_015400 [Aphanomyces stellatus]VFT92258.1 Aste57867_15456 [Aphanomyces stellatus]
MNRRDAWTAALTSPDAFVAFPAMKSLLGALKFTDRSDCSAWTRSLLSFVPTSLGYNFLVLRRSIAEDTSIDEEIDENGSMDDDDSKNEWILEALVDSEPTMLELSRQLSHHDVLQGHESAAYEFLRLMRTLFAHDIDAWDLPAWSSTWTPLLPLSASLPHSIQVELLMLLIDLTDAIPIEDSQSDVHISTIVSFLTVAIPPILLSDDDDSSSPIAVGAQAFLGQADLPYRLQCIRLLSHVLRRHPTALASCPHASIGGLSSSLVRRRLMTLIAEEDDILIDVLHSYLHFHMSISSQCHLPPSSLFWVDGLAPAPLFADFCAVLHDDHLVLIDLLSSDETESLAYLVGIFRYMCAHWSSCAASWIALGRFDAVQTLLVQTRLELDRLDRRQLLRFNVRPLIRRLEAIEAMAEATMDPSLVNLI